MNSVSGILKKNHFVEHLQDAAISQTSLKYVLVGNVTLAIKETVCNNARKQRFGISLNNIFLPKQLDYAGKSEQSFPRYKSLHEFSLSINPTHYFNSMESNKLTDEVIAPYLKNKVKNISLPPIHKGFLIRSIVK